LLFSVIPGEVEVGAIREERHRWQSRKGSGEKEPGDERFKTQAAFCGLRIFERRLDFAPRDKMTGAPR